MTTTEQLEKLRIAYNNARDEYNASNAAGYDSRDAYYASNAGYYDAVIETYKAACLAYFAAQPPAQKQEPANENQDHTGLILPRIRIQPKHEVWPAMG